MLKPSAFVPLSFRFRGYLVLKEENHAETCLAAGNAGAAGKVDSEQWTAYEK